MSSSHLKSVSISGSVSPASPSVQPPPAEPPAYIDPPETSNFQFGDLDFTPSALDIPTSAECVAHLKLLNAFHRLRYEVSNQKGLFGIYDSASGGKGERDRITEWIKEKKWAVYVTRAVSRFETWWSELPETTSGHPYKLIMNDFCFNWGNEIPTNFPFWGQPVDSSWLNPPLDVLMVWHSYKLNPRIYLEDCMRLSKHDLWATPFPWEVVHQCIDPDTFVYQLPDDAKASWEYYTGLTWNNLDGPNTTQVTCPGCLMQLVVPWTRTAKMLLDDESFQNFMTHDEGFAAKEFKECFKCKLVVTHEKLRVAKFSNDMTALRERGRPMPGTILGLDGKPEVAAPKKQLQNHDLFFPNRLVEIKEDFLFSFRLSPELTVESIKSRIELILATQYQRTLINSDQHRPDFLAKNSKIAVRRMLAQYWDNSSIFAIDLVGAVIRQGTFVQKMNTIDWYHSPSVMNTMDRSIKKYHLFIGLIGDNPKKTAVPTLDVDLAWHTHQLTPKLYYKYTVSETNKFVNHDDKIPENDLSEYFKWTCNAYERKFGQPYSECSCWYCECTRESQRRPLISRLNPAARGRLWEVNVLRNRQPTDPVDGPHISSHNAVMWSSDNPVLNRKLMLEQNDEAYAKACKVAKKNGREPPPRENYAYVYNAYGYPVYVPYYGPYASDPCIVGGTYCTDPTQIQGQPGGGGGGGCVAGTCGGIVIVGSCVGDSGPGCAGGCGGKGTAAGGCGTCSSGGGGCGGCGG